MSTRAPRRLQRRRTKGYRLPASTVCVGRPSKWGNPLRLLQNDLHSDLLTRACGYMPSDEGRHAATVVLHWLWIWPIEERLPIPAKPNRFSGVSPALLATWRRDVVPLHLGEPPSLADIRAALRGRNLACWCPLDRPCHGDTLLYLANHFGPGVIG